jgi:hypothetical protein
MSRVLMSRVHGSMEFSVDISPSRSDEDSESDDSESDVSEGSGSDSESGGLDSGWYEKASGRLLIFLIKLSERISRTVVRGW